MASAKIRPPFDLHQAESIAQSLYGITVQAEELPSDRDLNFLLKDAAGAASVLKIANAAEKRESLTLQNEAMRLIDASAGGICPEVYTGLNGEMIQDFAHRDGQTYFIRRIGYLPGVPLAGVNPQTPELLHGLGEALGKTVSALQNLHHSDEQEHLPWNMRNAPATVKKYIQFVTDISIKSLIGQYLSQYEASVAPLLRSLRTGFIHGDANDYNVLVSAAPAEDRKITGLIDFGDMGRSFIAAEPAIAAAYALFRKNNPLEAIADIIAGFHAQYPLSEDEIKAVFHFVYMRLCVSICMSYYQSSREPGNDYLVISRKDAVTALLKLQNIHPRFAEYSLRHACGMEPCPASETIRAFLHKNAPARLTEADLTKESRAVLDLSTGSPLTGNFSEIDNRTGINKRVREFIEQAGGICIGRYNEARIIHLPDTKPMTAAYVKERNSLHIGMDVFGAAGMAVYAPFDAELVDKQVKTAAYKHKTGDGTEFYTVYKGFAPDATITRGDKIPIGNRIGKIDPDDKTTGLPNHFHFMVTADLFGYGADYPIFYPPSERAVRLSICPDPNLLLKIPGSLFPPPEMDIPEIVQKRKRTLGRSLSISYKKPLKIVRGAMQYLYSADGQAYLDGVNNVCHVGHCHPKVVAALQNQVALLNTNTRYLHDTIVRYANRLLQTMPKPLDVCFFVCSGSEANELALRMARTHTGNTDIITVEGAYHGNTSGLIDISSYKFDGPGGKGKPGYVQMVPMPDPYRGIYRKNASDTGRKYGQTLTKAIDAIHDRGKRPAAFICESLLGCGGQVVLPEGYMNEAFRLVRNAGGVCIADEVQVGFGRVGSAFWGFEMQKAVPDIVTLGKPIGNGHPLAAVITTREIAESFANGMEYFNTFGGNPVSCAAGMAVMDVIEEEYLQQNALKTGTILLEGLKELQKRYSLIGDVRGAGLYLGVELVRDHDTLEPAAEEADYIINRARERGILLSTDGPLHNVLKMKPPIVFTEDNAGYTVEKLDNILAEDRLRK